MSKRERVDVLGVGIDPITIADALEEIRAWVDTRQAHYVCCAPAHAVMDCHDRPELLPVYNRSGLTTPDGMAIVWLLRWRGHPEVQRVYGPDLMLAVCAEGLPLGWRHYFYGGAPGVAEKLVARLQERFSGLQVAGIDSPPFRELTEEEDTAVCERILSSAADVVWVGIGSPRQELWMNAHADRVGASVLVGVGAAFDFLSGAKPQAPRWVQRGGLEWLFRLLSEPRRLWRRYIQYPRFAALVMVQNLRMVLRKD